MSIQSDTTPNLPQDDDDDNPNTPTIPHSEPAGGTGSLEAALEEEHNPLKRWLKILGPGLRRLSSNGTGLYVSNIRSGFSRK